MHGDADPFWTRDKAIKPRLWLIVNRDRLQLQLFQDTVTLKCCLTALVEPPPAITAAGHSFNLMGGGGAGAEADGSL